MQHVAVAVEASMSRSMSASVAKVDLPGLRVCDDLGAAALDDDFSEMHHGDALGEVQRHVHVVLDHHNGDIAGDARRDGSTSRRSSIERPAKGSSRSKSLGPLGQCHRDLDATPLAVGGLGEGPVGEVAETRPARARLAPRR